MIWLFLLAIAAILLIVIFWEKISDFFRYDLVWWFEDIFDNLFYKKPVSTSAKSTSITAKSQTSSSSATSQSSTGGQAAPAISSAQPISNQTDSDEIKGLKRSADIALKLHIDSKLIPLRNEYYTADCTQYLLDRVLELCNECFNFNNTEFDLKNDIKCTKTDCWSLAGAIQYALTETYQDLKKAEEYFKRAYASIYIEDESTAEFYPVYVYTLVLLAAEAGKNEKDAEGYYAQRAYKAAEHFLSRPEFELITDEHKTLVLSRIIFAEFVGKGTTQSISNAKKHKEMLKKCGEAGAKEYQDLSKFF